MIEKAWVAVGKWVAVYIAVHLSLWGLRRLIKRIFGKKDDGDSAHKS